MPISSALPARCQGAAAFLSTSSSTGTANLFAGTITDLFRITPGDAYVWQNVTRVASPYSVSSDEYWEFEFFNNSVLASNLDTAIQTIDITSGTNFADLSASAPKARHMAVVKNSFLMLGFTDDPIDGNQPQRVWWSAAGDATSWPSPGGITAAQVQSGYFDLLGDGGAVQAIRSGLVSADALVFQQFAVRRAVYAGPPQVFEFLPVENARGTPAPWSPVVVGGTCYYRGQDGWYANDGSASTPIGVNKIDKFFEADANASTIFRMVGAADPVGKMVWWLYISNASPDGNPDRMLGYNWQLQRWCIVYLSLEYLAKFIGIGYTLDELYTVLGYTLDNLPAPLDSPIWAGGGLSLGVFDQAHTLNYLTGPALAATIETQEIEPIPGRRTLVTNARPLIDGSGAGGPAVSIAHRERQIDQPTYSPAAPINFLGFCPGRASGRYLRAQQTVAAGGDWRNWSGVALDMVQQGSR